MPHWRVSSWAMKAIGSGLNAVSMYICTKRRRMTTVTTMVAPLETRNGMSSRIRHGIWPIQPAESMASRMLSPRPRPDDAPVVGAAEWMPPSTLSPISSMAWSMSSLCWAAVNTSVSLNIAMATSLTPSSRSPSARVLTLASSRTHMIASIVLAIGLTAERATVRLNWYMSALYSAGVFSRSATRSSPTPDPIELRMPTMKSTMRGLPSTGRCWRTGPRPR